MNTIDSAIQCTRDHLRAGHTVFVSPDVYDALYELDDPEITRAIFSERIISGNAVGIPMHTLVSPFFILWE